MIERAGRIARQQDGLRHAHLQIERRPEHARQVPQRAYAVVQAGPVLFEGPKHAFVPQAELDRHLARIARRVVLSLHRPLGRKRLGLRLSHSQEAGLDHVVNHDDTLPA